MGDCPLQRTSSTPGAAVPRLVSANRQYAQDVTDTPLVELSRALSNFQALITDPRVTWMGKLYDGEDCAALEKILQEYKACVGPAVGVSRLHEAAQRVTDYLDRKVSQTAQLRRLSTQKCKKRDLLATFARKLKIQHQLFRQRWAAPVTTSALEFAAAVVQVLSGICRDAKCELSSAREECEHLRHQLTSPKSEDEATREKAKRLCLEGHAFRFGYGCSPQMTRAFSMYIAAANLGAAEGFTCAGILLEDGLVDASACKESSFPLPARPANATSASSEQHSIDSNHSHPVSLHSQTPLSTFEKNQADRQDGSGAVSPTRPRVRPLEPVGTPTAHDRSSQARYFFEQAAQQGHPDALFRLGRMAETGQGGFSTNYSRAVQYYRQAAGKGHAEAQVAVGYAYERGDVYTRDYHQRVIEPCELHRQQGLVDSDRMVGQEEKTKALKWYKKAAEQGSPTGMNNLASLYYRGCGCPVDYEQAASLFKKAAAVGHIHACYNLAICYEFGRGVLAEDSDRALKLYLQAAHAGHVRAAAALGMLLLKLNAAAAKPAEAYTEAARWLQMAASKEDSEATFLLGWLYETGLGLIRDPGQALACYRKAAAGGAGPKVHLRLAHLLFSGQAGSHLASKKEAFKHYCIAAEEGNDPEAWNCLGLCHEEGLGSVDGIPQYATAAKCYEHAVQHESADAMCNLARLLSKGLGVPRNLERGFELLKRAACKGHLQAKLALENHGRIVPRPLLEVALGYAEAADKPPPPAVKPTSPLLQENRRGERLRATLPSKEQLSEKQESAEKPCTQPGEYEARSATLSIEKKSPGSSSLDQNDTHASSPETPLCMPPSRTESPLRGGNAHLLGCTSVGVSDKGSEQRSTTPSTVPPVSSILLQKSGSSLSVRSPTKVAHACGPATLCVPLLSKTNEKVTTRSEECAFKCTSDASSSSKEVYSLLSPLSPGQIACWPECPSFPHNVSASSPSNKVFYGTLIPQARNSLAHLLVVDRWAPIATPSASVAHHGNHSRHLYKEADDPTMTLVNSPPVTGELFFSSGGRENVGCRLRQEQMQVRARRSHEKAPIMQEASFIQFLP